MSSSRPKTYAKATPPAFYFDEAAVERLNNWCALQPGGWLSPLCEQTVCPDQSGLVLVVGLLLSCLVF